MMPTNQSDDAVTLWLHALAAGDAAAAQKLWERFATRLAQLARRKLSPRSRILVDEEDIALSAFGSFCRGVAGGRYPQLQDRNDLWRLLVTITLHKTLHRVRDEGRRKRSGLNQRADLDLNPAVAVEQLLAREPSPAFAAEMAEQCKVLLDLLPSQELVQLVLWKFEGFSNAEISRMCGRAERTVERKLALVRKFWASAPRDD